MMSRVIKLVPLPEGHAAIHNEPDARSTDEAFLKGGPAAVEKTVTMRSDADLLEWFHRERGGRTRINPTVRTCTGAHADDRSSG
jgi:uncharacterized protein (DUF4415 family)